MSQIVVDESDSSIETRIDGFSPAAPLNVGRRRLRSRGAAIAYTMARRLLRSAQGLVGRAAALGGATLLACGPPSIADCVANPASYAFEKAELLKIVDLSGIPVAGMTDSERCGVSTITRYCSFGSGKLVTEPPDSATIRTLMAQLRASSPLGGTADEWPDPTGSDDDKTEYAALATKFMALGRYVAQLRETALRRELESIGIAPASAAGAASTKPSREEEEKKNHRQRAADLTKMAAALYSIDFGDPCDSALLVETSHAFGRNRLAVAHLKSGKYGRPSVHVVEKPHYTAGDDGTLKEDAPLGTSATLTRNASVLEQIFNVTESLVIAGIAPIDGNLAHCAEACGVVRRGTADEKQVNFDMTTKLKVDRAFTRLSGALGPKELEALFEDAFIPTLGGLMADGHSCSSGCQNILKTAAWMRPRPQETVAKTANSAGASTDATGTAAAPTLKADKNGVVRGADGEALFYTASRVSKMQQGHTKQITEMKAAKQRLISGGGGGWPQKSARFEDRRRDEAGHAQDSRRDHHQTR